MNAAVAVEVLRLRTVRQLWWALLAAELLVVVGVAGVGHSGGDLTRELPRALAHVGLASIASLVLGILAVAGEYRHRTITDTYLSFPRRSTPLLAKLLVVTVAGGLLGVAASLTAVGTAALVWAADGAAWDWTDEATRTVAGGVVWNMAFAAIGVALGAVVRNVMTAIAIGLGWIAVVETVVGQLLGSEAARWLPFSAGLSLGLADALADPLPQVAAALVLTAYVVVLSLVAAFVTLGRDVT